MRLGLDSFEILYGRSPGSDPTAEKLQRDILLMESELEEGAYRVSVCSTDAEICPEIQVIRLGL